MSNELLSRSLFLTFSFSVLLLGGCESAAAALLPVALMSSDAAISVDLAALRAASAAAFSCAFSTSTLAR